MKTGRKSQNLRGCNVAVITDFETWLEDVAAWLMRLGVSDKDVLDLDVRFYRVLWWKGLTPEQAAREDACL